MKTDPYSNSPGPNYSLLGLSAGLSLAFIAAVAYLDKNYSADKSENPSHVSRLADSAQLAPPDQCLVKGAERLDAKFGQVTAKQEWEKIVYECFVSDGPPVAVTYEINEGAKRSERYVRALSPTGY